jgi:ectoine hydroxylase-related dioxygenase (phytanoyl-CoA dioxygenase family)
LRDQLPLSSNRASWARAAHSSTGGLAWKYGVDHTINSAPMNSDTSRGQVQAQLLHRDGHKWMLDLVPEVENELKTIWALSEFTEQTGATKVIRGSHRWPSIIALSPPSSEVAETVEMEAGSCLIYTSGVLHAGGNNQVCSSAWCSRLSVHAYVASTLISASLCVYGVLR